MIHRESPVSKKEIVNMKRTHYETIKRARDGIRNWLLRRFLVLISLDGCPSGRSYATIDAETGYHAVGPQKHIYEAPAP